MTKITYRQLWEDSGAKSNGVAYSTFYRRVRYHGESLEKASRAPRNQREITKASCLYGRERDRNTIGFRPLKGDNDRFTEAIASLGTDTKSDILALLLHHFLEVCDSHQISPKEAIALIFQFQRKIAH
jgi:uncharacterized protein (DUF2384 family)